jgi:hypothetical protein
MREVKKQWKWLILITAILAAFKLSGLLDISWLVVFCPLWGMWAVMGFIFLLCIVGIGVMLLAGLLYFFIVWITMLFIGKID